MSLKIWHSFCFFKRHVIFYLLSWENKFEYTTNRNAFDWTFWLKSSLSYIDIWITAVFYDYNMCTEFVNHFLCVPFFNVIVVFLLKKCLSPTCQGNGFAICKFLILCNDEDLYFPFNNEFLYISSRLFFYLLCYYIA